MFLVFRRSSSTSSGTYIARDARARAGAPEPEVHENEDLFLSSFLPRTTRFFSVLHLIFFYRIFCRSSGEETVLFSFSTSSLLQGTHGHLFASTLKYMVLPVAIAMFYLFYGFCAFWAVGRAAGGLTLAVGFWSAWRGTANIVWPSKQTETTTLFLSRRDWQPKWYRSFAFLSLTGSGRFLHRAFSGTSFARTSLSTLSVQRWALFLSGHLWRTCIFVHWGVVHDSSCRSCYLLCTYMVCSASFIVHLIPGSAFGPDSLILLFAGT